MDCIITDKEIDILSNFENKILDFVVDVDFEHGFSEAQEESEMFECNVQDGLDEEEKKLELIISRSYYVTVTND